VRRPGRPPLDPDDRSVAITFRAPRRVVDGLYAQATQQRITVPELIRRALEPLLRRPRPDRQDQDF
jgi:hypothetical protein